MGWLAAAVVDGNLDAAFGILAQEGRRTRHREHVGDVNGLIGADLHTAEVVGAFELGHGRFGGFRRFGGFGRLGRLRLGRGLGWWRRFGGLLTAASGYEK